MNEVCYLFVANALPVLARASDIFLVEPENMTVEESDNATFRCSLLNSSFDILWLVNGYYAGYRDERGITIQPYNSTTSQLNIVGYRFNNHAQVQCGALLTDIHTYKLLYYVESEVAFLTVRLDEGQNLQTSDLSTVSWTVNNVTGTMSIQLSILHSTPKAATPPISEWNKQLLAGTAGLILPLLVTMTVFLFISRRLFKKYHGGAKSEESPSDDVQMKANELYEYAKPMHCQRNPAYDNVTLNLEDIKHA